MLEPWIIITEVATWINRSRERRTEARVGERWGWMGNQQEKETKRDSEKGLERLERSQRRNGFVF